MNETLRYILISYIAMISLISAVVCIADKHNSKIKGRRRVPEKTLSFFPRSAEAPQCSP